MEWDTPPVQLAMTLLPTGPPTMPAWLVFWFETHPGNLGADGAPARYTAALALPRPGQWLQGAIRLWRIENMLECWRCTTQAVPAGRRSLGTGLSMCPAFRSAVAPWRDVWAGLLGSAGQASFLVCSGNGAREIDDHCLIAMHLSVSVCHLHLAGASQETCSQLRNWAHNRAQTPCE
jgi:hypothetical protein